MNPDLNTLQLGGNPRTYADFAALKEELNTRVHPAHPDIDWARAHGLCPSLFNQNGVNLPTCAWFTLMRQANYQQAQSLTLSYSEEEGITLSFGEISEVNL